MVRRLNKPQHVRQLLAKIINELEEDKEMDKEQRARTIGYLSNISLTAMRYHEAEERLYEVEQKLKEYGL